jgi:hypothetical protein
MAMLDRAASAGPASGLGGTVIAAWQDGQLIWWPT